MTVVKLGGGSAAKRINYAERLSVSSRGGDSVLRTHKKREF